MNPKQKQAAREKTYSEWNEETDNAWERYNCGKIRHSTFIKRRAKAHEKHRRALAEIEGAKKNA